jgi:hypothetical protein
VIPLQKYDQGLKCLYNELVAHANTIERLAQSVDGAGGTAAVDTDRLRSLNVPVAFKAHEVYVGRVLTVSELLYAAVVTWPRRLRHRCCRGTCLLLGMIIQATVNSVRFINNFQPRTIQRTLYEV